MKEKTTKDNFLISLITNLWIYLWSWNFYFSLIIIIIVLLAVYHSMYPSVKLVLTFSTFKLVLPGDYFYELIFNPLWVVAAFFYERSIHDRLGAADIKVGKIKALTLDSAIRKQDTILVDTVNKILSDKDKGIDAVSEIIDDNKIDTLAEDIDTISKNKKVNLNF